MAASRLPPGYATSELNRTNWEVPSRYVDINPIGNGAYGQVCSSENTDLNKRVAIKKLARPFQSVTHAKRTYRELKLLHHMKHENVINLLDVFSPCLSFDTFTDVYFVSDLMGADLNTVNKCQKLSDEHVKFLVYQILRGLKHGNSQARRHSKDASKNLETFSRVAVRDYIHSAGVIHRDLKPSNLAVNEDCELRILDFGLARMTDEEMTGYVATRWYRAPEIMLNWMHYSDKVDMWSVGCIMAELLTGQVLFPGTDNIDQLTKILSITGTPSEAFLTKIESDSARDYVRNMETFARKDFYHFFHGANPVAINILERMLDLDKDNRPSATEALAHEYFAQFHDPSDEPTAEPFDDEFEKMDLQLNEWKEKIFQLILEIKNGIPY